MVYKTAPDNFNPKFEVVSCYIEHRGEILLLLRQDYKTEGDRWGVPAGKVDSGENKLNAMVREIQEETGQQMSADDLEYLTTVFVEYPEYCFVYHMFRAKLDERPLVKLNPEEHKDHLLTL